MSKAVPIASEEARIRRGCQRSIADSDTRGADSPVAVADLLAEIDRRASRPLEEAVTLPAGAYTSPEFFAWECEAIFRHEWLCLGHVSQLPLAGDFLTLELLGEPLVVVRGKDGEVRVLSRVCPHRGMDIMPPGFGDEGDGPGERRGPAEGHGHTRLFLCSYHSWTFDLDGRLKACPEMQQAKGFSRDEVGLKEFRSGIWNGFLFVNLDGGAETSIAEQYAEFGEAIAPWNLEGMVVVNEQEWDCPFNWKVMIENFMESYHHAGAHARTLQTMMPARDTWTDGEKPHFIRCHLPLKARIRESIAETEAKGGQWDIFPPIAGLDHEARHEWGLYLGFPTFMFVVAADCAIWYRLQPLAPDRNRLLTTILVPEETTLHPEFGSMLERGVHDATAFHLEDMEACTAVQRGLYASGYQRGRLSHLEMPVWLIQRYLAARGRGTWPTIDRPAAPGQRDHRNDV